MESSEPREKIFTKIVRVTPAQFAPLNLAAAIKYASLEYSDILTKDGRKFLEEFAKRIEMSFFD